MARATLRGNGKIIFFEAPTDTPSSLAAVTAAEITAADDRTGVAEAEALSAMDGWQTSASTINVPDVLSLTTGNIAGETTFGTATLTYYTDDTTNAAWAQFVEGVSGHIGIWPFGTGTGNEYSIFSVEVISRSRALTTGNEAETHTVSFAVGSRTEGTEAA